MICSHQTDTATPTGWGRPDCPSSGAHPSCLRYSGEQMGQVVEKVCGGRDEHAVGQCGTMCVCVWHGKGKERGSL